MQLIRIPLDGRPKKVVAADLEGCRTKSHTRKADEVNKLFLLAFVLCFSAKPGSAQLYNGSIGIFADPAGSSCNLPGTPGVQTYYFLHLTTLGTTASVWAAPKPACLTGVRLADLPVFSINFGNTETGITIGYGLCKTGTFLIMAVQYNVTSATDCCYWSVVADPTIPSGLIEVGGCLFTLEYATGGRGIINGTPTCTCNVAAGDATWGHVKALYTE